MAAGVLERAAVAAAALMVLAAPGAFRSTSWGKDLTPGQYDVDSRAGPRRSLDVVVEEPRPPLTAIETEGRGEHRNCRSATVGDLQGASKVIPPEQPCEH